MKIDNRLPLFTFLIIGLAWLGCSGENPVIDLDDPSTFPGTYKIVSFTDVSGENLGQAGMTVKAGEPTTISVQEGDVNISMTLTLTGTMTLTETRYSVSQTVKMSLGGLAEDTQTDTDEGTYTIEGSTITIVSDDESEDPEVGTITVNKSEMTLTFEDMTVVVKKQ